MPIDPETRRRVSRAGGKATPGDKRAFSKDRVLAARAGSAGGKATAVAKDAAWYRAWLAKRGLPESGT
jgi:general stress protein YciG